jgi:hypothetical protein
VSLAKDHTYPSPRNALFISRPHALCLRDGLPRLRFPAALTVDLHTARALVMFINIMRTEPTPDSLRVKSHSDLQAPGPQDAAVCAIEAVRGPPTHMAHTGPVIPMMT